MNKMLGEERRARQGRVGGTQGLGHGRSMWVYCAWLRSLRRARPPSLLRYGWKGSETAGRDWISPVLVSSKQQCPLFFFHFLLNLIVVWLLEKWHSHVVQLRFPIFFFPGGDLKICNESLKKSQTISSFRYIMLKKLYSEGILIDPLMDYAKIQLYECSLQCCL